MAAVANGPAANAKGAIAKYGGGGIYEMLAKMGESGEIARALPRIGITPERMMRLAMTALRTTPKLAECEAKSILASVVQCAALGLEPNTPLGHAWILPYAKKAQLVVGYKGFIALADRGGVSMGGDVVYSADHWRVPRPGETIIDHIPKLSGDRGHPIAAYAFAMRAGRPLQFRICGPADIERAQDASPSYCYESRMLEQAKRDGKRFEPSSPWFLHPDAMWIKTAVRRLAAFVPLSSDAAPAMARAIELDTAAETGAPQIFDVTADFPDGGPGLPPDAGESGEALAADIAAAREAVGGPESAKETPREAAPAPAGICAYSGCGLAIENGKALMTLGKAYCSTACIKKSILDNGKR